MYHHDGHDIFVVDCHMHFWDANPENWRNKYGESWIKCFHAFHSGLSPAEEVWPFDKFCQYGDEVLVNPGLSCGACAPCLRGDDNLCRHYQIIGEHSPGGYAIASARLIMAARLLRRHAQAALKRSC